ncbi:MAG: hypothetical protein HOZ81_09055 [Streptomyces sp.]|nr:hypothetical protein [Streptomyces sp.]NUS23673.1 hypothetical protein [Streptomyces sp.]NUS76401.1 hypothetical protein [Streptomyces sp.]
MREEQPGFITRLKSALCLAPGTPLVFLGNFEVETRWGRDMIGLPVFSRAAAGAMVNRMDEFALLLAGPDDLVVLKEPPDPGYLAQLSELGLRLPRVLVPEQTDPARTVTEDALHAPALVEELSRLAGSGAALLPHGVSEAEEALAVASGLPLAAPPAAVCEAVNSKVYSRRLTERLDLRRPRGWACDSLADWSTALGHARELLGEGRTIGVKDAFGVSGKGIVQVEDERRLNALDRMVTTRARRAGTERIGLVVEEWVAKSADLNYQFTLGRDASLHFDFVKEAVTERGVHKGHRIPARLDAEQHAELVSTARLLGRQLSDDGYFGVVGVDAMVDPDGGLYPVVEINARNNMSTYQLPLQEEFVAAGRSALARHYTLHLGGELDFATVRHALGERLFSRGSGSGLLVNNFATVNAARATREEGGTTEGRLYGLVVGEDFDAVSRIDAEVERELASYATHSEGARP